MPNHFLHRIMQEDGVPSALDYVSSQAAHCAEGDLFIIFQSHTLRILGAYRLEKENALTCIVSPKREVTLRELYASLSFITEVTDRTVRMFKKKDRMILQKDYETIIAAMSKTS